MSANTPHEPSLPKWAKFYAPGDAQEDVWLLQFCDQDVRDMIWIGEDAERDARAAFARYNPSWNCRLFQLVRVAAPPEAGYLMAELERLRAENTHLTKQISSGILPGLLDQDETDALVDFIKDLRKGDFDKILQQFGAESQNRGKGA